jgi:uncharacterized lipoprotein YddW (UPF0748 family)
MKSGTFMLTVLLGLILLIAVPALAQPPSELAIYFYQEGQAVPVTRMGVLSGDPQADAETLFAALVAGPTPDEQARGLTSPLPPGTELVAVTVSGDAVVADLRMPLDFLREELDPYRSDLIVEQVVKTVHPLGLHRVFARAEDESGEFIPVSSFLPPPPVVVPTIPPNDDAAPDRPGAAPAPQVGGQPPAFGQGQPHGALTGKTVWLSAGHGWYWSSTLNRWTTQRGNNYGLVEDFSNAEAVNYYLARYLWNAGADVWLVRERAMTEHEIIVDNDDGAPAYVETGSWTTSGWPGYNGGTYRYAASAEDLSATATWTPNLPEAGWYAVWAWYRHGTNRPTDVRYEIHHAGGVTMVSISQEVHGQTWYYLGEYRFDAGTAGRVTLLNESDDPGQAVIADAVRFGGGLGSIEEPGGASGEPRWEEAAKYWVHYQGAPPEIYDSDVTARPLYAEWESAKGYPGEAENAVYISWHTNAGGGTGSESYIHNTELPTGSVELQDWIHPELISDLRAAWDPAWVNRGQKAADFGEVRELSMIPGVLLEVAFHDTEDPGDADDLREPVFRQIAARAVFQGIVKYHAHREGAPVRLSPEPPERLIARYSGPDEVTLAWRPPPCCDGVVGDAATAYKVYQSADGRAFDNGTEAIDPSLTLVGLPPGTLRFFRVTALNEGGESFPTPVVAVRTPQDEGLPAFLVVDGFDRLDQEAMIPQWESPFLGTDQRMFLERMNRYDYAVEHGGALAACGKAFDGAVNEAVEAGDISLGDYQAVDWFVGEDSVVDAALSDVERALLRTYLDSGGRLLISGSEIGYDLVENGRDPAFYHDYLQASYLGDDAGTYQFAGAPGGILDGWEGSFDDSTQGTYDVGYPDRMAETATSNLVLNYAGGTADGAAVAYSGDSRAVYFGFPLEAVTDPLTRTAIFCAAANYLLLTEGPDLSFFPDRSAVTYPGESTVYTHTLVNLSNAPDIFDLTHHSSQGWIVTYTSPISLGIGLGTNVLVTIDVPPEVPSGTVDITVITATSQADPGVFAAVTDITTVIHEPPIPPSVTPRIINPGFEQGLGQSAWRVSAPDGNPVFSHLDNLPGYVEPHSGNWLAWVGGYTPGITATTALTQVLALPSGEPTATLSLSWFAHTGATTPSTTDTLSVGIYDLSGTLQADLLTVTNQSPTGTWQTEEFDLSSFVGQVVQIAFRAISSDTAFFADDVNLITTGLPGPDEFRALWVDAYHDGIKNRRQIDELVETARAGSFNALVVQVRRRGDTYYPSLIDPWAPDANPDFDALAYLIERAHAAGIEVHAWATTLAIWNGDTPPDAPDHTFNVHGPGATGRDYWLMTSYAGEEQPGDGVYFLDPGHPDVVEYTVAIYAELAANYDLDGLHLDRIRYPVPQGAYCQDQVWYCQDWGYNPTSVARFQQQTGRVDVPDPLDEVWIQWRRDQVTALVRRIYLTVTAIDPRLRVSAALSSIGSAPSDDLAWETRSPYRQQLQDWRGWLEEGIVDLGLPMTYRNDEIYPADFNKWIAWEKDHQYGRGVVVGTGLYINTLQDSMDQWLRVRQPSPLGHHALGMCGYSYASHNDEGLPRRDLINAAVTEVFTQSAPVPAIPWKDDSALGHLMGALTQPNTCRSVDGYPVALTGPLNRTLLTDGSGWFGAVDLPPGEYWLAAEVVTPSTTISQPVTIIAGTVTEQDLALPACPSRSIYLPLVLKHSNP